MVWRTLNDSNVRRPQLTQRILPPTAVCLRGTYKSSSLDATFAKLQGNNTPNMPSSTCGSSEVVANVAQAGQVACDAARQSARQDLSLAAAVE